MGIQEVIGSKRAFYVEHGGALEVLSVMPSEVIHVACTSPPYYQLRQYQGVKASWWPEVNYQPMAGLPEVTVPGMDACLGNEPDLNAYIGHLVLIFRQLKRVLRKDGTFWLNIGDSFAGSWGNQGRLKKGRGKQRPINKRMIQNLDADHVGTGQSKTGSLHSGMKSKDLMMVPYRLALAMQADGWYLRQIISWQKTCPMPSSTKDRPNTATEEFFLFSVSPKYYYDIDACRIPSAGSTIARDRYTRVMDNPEEQYGVAHDHETVSHKNGRNLWNWWDIQTDDEDEETAPAKLAWRLGPDNLREKKIRHYAAYPRELPRRAIKLGTSVHGCCLHCGAGWKRVDGFVPSCKCKTDKVVEPLVLDPFCGSGTTGLVARELNRRFIGVEASSEYQQLAIQRIVSSAPLADKILQEKHPSLFGEMDNE